MRTDTRQKLLTSVGIDIGTTTSHLVFSSILLERDFLSRTEKFKIKERKVLHSGPIHLTPFSDPHTIDFESLRQLILKDYADAGVELSDIDTGAVIITGETARTENAEGIVAALAGEAGKFVAATAGPNFESVLAAHGSGAVAKSAETRKTIFNVDVGGGSSNIAVCNEGRVIATAAINVGGRLVATDDRGTITRLEETGRKVGEKIGVKLALGGRLSEGDRRQMAQALAEALMQAIAGDSKTELTRLLMMTQPLVYAVEPDLLMLSGGVAEFVYGRETQHYYDLGRMLADEISKLVNERGFKLIEPEHRIRATVIGAGQSTLEVSGSTTFLTSGLDYPLRNLPVVNPHVPLDNTWSSNISVAIQDALMRFDLKEGTDPVILAFINAVRPSYQNLTEFAKGVVEGLPNTVAKGKPILMCFDSDIGNSVGNVMMRETDIESKILSIDEITLHEGDFVDIGEPIIEGVVVPVVVKTLVFES
ncbi:MAG: ethanolamine ammonia-lyase reactivating factor EutA [Candidatus Thorarchaeota archaeon]|nr:MAG: ethanolamine ammonia-lyase reactivating factor EutA [Candidatus Thorarchaeota archaeon]